MPEAEVKIDNKGNMTIDYIGCHGPECHVAEGNVKERLKRFKMSTINNISREQFEDRMMEEEKI